jgi:predicted dehydrogenase
VTAIAVKPRLAFAGLGWIGRHRMNAIVESEAGEAAYLCDVDTELKFEDLLDSDADAIVIATPSAMHAEQSIAALERGKAVFCQKPLGRNAEETRRVVDAARANDRLLGVDLSYRFTDAMRAVRRLVAEKTIGDVYAIDLVFHNAYGPDKPWFYDRALSGGGCVIDLGIHLVDLAGSFYDFVAEHYQKTRTTRLTEPGDAWSGRAAVDFARKLAESNRFDPEIEHVVEVAEALDSIYRGAM